MFLQLFEQLFGLGDITVSMDGDFTLIIEQNSCEKYLGSSSDGERILVSSAYRLALNVMIKKVGGAIHSNLLILDEPTDGFSREQLLRLQDILKELNCE